MMFIKSTVGILLAGSVAAVLALPASAADLRLKFAGQFPIEHQGSIMMEQIKAEIEAADVGLKVTTFPANQLGSGEELLEDAIRGNVDMVYGFVYAHKDPAFEINSLPFLVSDWEEINYVYGDKTSAYNQIFAERLDNIGLHLLANNSEGFIGVVADKKPADWAGIGPKNMNIRVWSSNVAKVTTEALGYTTTTMNWAEVFPAIQSGIVDGAICCTAQNVYTTFAVSDVGKYFIPYGVFIEGTTYYASNKTWEKMNDEQKAVVTAAFEKGSAEFTQWNRDNDDSFRAKLLESGYEILDPSAEEKAALVAHVRTNVWPLVGEIVGQDILDRLLADK